MCHFLSDRQNEQLVDILEFVSRQYFDVAAIIQFNAGI